MIYIKTVKLNINKTKITLINITKVKKHRKINILNNDHEAINFTIEKGNNDKLEYLDVQVKGNKNRF